MVKISATYWEHSSAQGLSQNENVRFDVFVVDCKAASGARQSSLHFVGDPQNVVLVAERAHTFQVALLRHHHSSLALNWLHHKCAHIRICQGFLYKIFKPLVKSDRILRINLNFINQISYGIHYF
jgi:hypothetical protein